MKDRIFLILLAIASLLCLAGRFAEAPLNWQIDYATKPLLMPLLYLLYRQMTRPDLSLLQSLKEFFTMGLFFAWMGDLFLMIADGDMGLFILGLGSFLIMQIQYIFLYRQNSQNITGGLKAKPYLALPSVLIAIGFYILLFPELGPVLKVAVGCYAIALASMTLAAINRLGKCSMKSFALVSIGAFSFMFSDMMIGLNTFLFEDGFANAGFWIMLTYIGGQFLIVKGIIASKEIRF
jgi:uncharacterized membrane protein YhhN